MQVTVVTKWITDADRPTDEQQHYNVADVVKRFPGNWTDITGQPDENLPLETNVVVWLGEVDAATLAALEADADVVVLTVEETDVDGRVTGTKRKDANPTAAERTKLTALLTKQGVTGQDRAALVRAGVSRETLVDDLRAWAKARPKAQKVKPGNGEVGGRL